MKQKKYPFPELVIKLLSNKERRFDDGGYSMHVLAETEFTAWLVLIFGFMFKTRRCANPL